MLFAANSRRSRRPSRWPLILQALATIIASVFLVTPGFAQSKYTPGVIKADSPEGKNIKAAADFIREMGNSEVADQIVSSLNGGTFYSGILPSGTGAGV